MTEKRFSISFENNGCSRCLFLNSSDTGEDCKILKSEICEDEWSNIDYQFKKNWRYKGCPLIHHENLNEHKGIIAIKGDMSIEDSLNLLEENEQLKQQLELYQELYPTGKWITELTTEELEKELSENEL